MRKIKKGDNVMIILGKDRSKSGTVERVLRKDQKAVILGLNVYKRHVKKQAQLEGGVLDLSKPINLSNLMLICPNCKKPTRIGFKIEAKDKFRICKKCHKEIK